MKTQQSSLSLSPLSLFSHSYLYHAPRNVKKVDKRRASTKCVHLVGRISFRTKDITYILFILNLDLSVRLNFSYNIWHCGICTTCTKGYTCTKKVIDYRSSQAKFNIFSQRTHEIMLILKCK